MSALLARADYPLWVLHGKRSTSWFGPYATREEARDAADRIARHGDSLGVKEPTRIGRARYCPAGIEFDAS